MPKIYIQNESSLNTFKVQICNWVFLVLWVRTWYLSHFHVFLILEKAELCLLILTSTALSASLPLSHKHRNERGESPVRALYPSLAFLIRPIHLSVLKDWIRGFHLFPFESQVDFISLDSRSKFVLFLLTVLMEFLSQLYLHNLAYLTMICIVEINLAQ